MDQGCDNICRNKIMAKPSAPETIRRGFYILEMMNERPITHAQIHTKLINNYGIEVSIRSIERQMWTLTDAFPSRIEVDDTKSSYEYKLPQNHRKFSNMSPVEAVCLQLAFDYLFPLLPNKSMDPVMPYLREAEEILKQNAASKMRNWKNKVLTLNEGLQLMPAKVNDGVLQNIHAALWDGNTITASYMSKNKAFPSNYELHPAGLVYRGRISYLVGSFANDTSKIIYLPLQRFHGVKLLNKKSVHRNKKIKDLAKDLMGFQLNPKKINVVLKFSKMAGSHLMETPLTKDQKISVTNDGFLKVQAIITDDMELRFWIRAFGDSVEVMKPKKLRDEFKQISKRMVRLYE